MLGAVHVPGLDGEQDDPLRAGLIAMVEQLLDQGIIILDHPGAAPQLDSLPAREIDQEEEGAVVFRQVSKRDVLPVAAVVGESERFLTLMKPFGPPRCWM